MAVAARMNAAPANLTRWEGPRRQAATENCLGRGISTGGPWPMADDLLEHLLTHVCLACYTELAAMLMAC